MSATHTIGEVSRIAGIPRDLLRMWERRYGYPDPDRDARGERVYSSGQLEKLTLIRQLMEQGKRPGRLVSLELTELRSLLAESSLAEVDLEQLLRQLRLRDAGAMRDWFTGQLRARGLRAFIHQVVAPVTLAVGDAWSRGELAIHEEHLYTETVTSLVRQSLTECGPVRDGATRIMLTTVTGERHSLGLLMAEALLRLGGAEVVTFGTEMPFRDIREAAQSHAVNIIGLSFSAAFGRDDALAMLTGLRRMIDAEVRIWVGGAAFGGTAEMPEGVELFASLYALERGLVDLQ